MEDWFKSCMSIKLCLKISSKHTKKEETQKWIKTFVLRAFLWGSRVGKKNVNTLDS